MAKGSGFDICEVARKGVLSVAFCLVVFAAVTASAACTNPPGLEGDILYNSDHKSPQFCDGTDWWSMKGSAAALPSCPEGDGIVMTSAGDWECSPGGPP